MNKKKHLFLLKGVIFILIILSGLYLRFLLLKIPLSYDEGEWAYITTRLLKGNNLYVDIASSNGPLLYLPYFLSESILGHGFGNLRFIGITWNIITVILIYFLTKTVFNKRIGFYALLLALIYTLSYRQEGMFNLLAEHLSQLPLFLSLLVLVSALKSKKDLLFFLSGIFMSVAWNFREHYIILNSFIVLYLIYGKFLKKSSWRQIILFVFGSSLPFFAILSYLYLNHSLKSYWVEVFLDRFKYSLAAIDYKLDFYILWDRTKNIIFLFLLSLFSFIYLFFKKNDKYLFFSIYLVFIANILNLISTGNRYFNHYFLYLTYGSLILSAVGLDFIINRIKKLSAVASYFAIFLVALILVGEYLNNLDYFRNFNDYGYNKNIYTNNIVNYKLLNYLKTVSDDERILFLGLSVPNYYYLNRVKDENVPSTLFFTLYSHNLNINNKWSDWFENFKTKPAKVIVSDFATSQDIFLIPEFRQYVSEKYYLADKINQHYILKLKSDAPKKIKNLL